MASEEMGPPGSASGLAQVSSIFTASMASSYEQDAIIRIPFRAILDFVLAELGIPEAEYRREICGGNKICVTVLFDASTIKGAPARMSISGTYSTDDEVAEDTAALKAIEYLETAANVVIRDYSYGKLKRLEEESERLMEQLEEANYCISKLVRGWLLAVRCVCSFSHSLRPRLAALQLRKIRERTERRYDDSRKIRCGPLRSGRSRSRAAERRAAEHGLKLLLGKVSWMRL